MAVRSFPSGPPALSGFRGMTNFATLPGFLNRIAIRYGPIASWKMFRTRVYFINEAGAIDRLLTADGYVVLKGRGIRKLRRLLGMGLLTSDEPLHLRQRRLVQPAFHRERIAGYAATMIAFTREATAGLVPGEIVAVDQLMNRLTLRIAANTLLSADVDDDADTIGSALTAALDTFPQALAPFGELLDLLSWHPVTRRARAARARLDGVIYRLIEERRAEGTDHGDLLSILLASRDEEGNAMPDDLVRDEALTLLLAGHETTANALTWTLDALARDPAVEARLHAELDAVLGDREATPADAMALPYTRSIISEALRMRPPAWILGRGLRSDFALLDYDLPAGSAVICSPLVTHRNPAYWQQPDAFRPERWTNGETDNLPRGAYFPFGGGNRVCIGEGFAWTEGVLLLAGLARRHRFVLTDPTDVPLDPSVTLRPGRPVMLRVEDR